jgi:hypothetical protein
MAQSNCPFHLDNNYPEECYYCRMAVSSVKLGYWSAPWLNPDVEEGYEDGSGIGVTPTIDRGEGSDNG